jgi:thioredoxin-like negative regulator of GroEL
MNLKLFKSGALWIALMSLSLATFAAGTQTFDRPGFEAAQKAGRPIVVHVRAGWCVECAEQTKVLARLMPQPQYKNLAVFYVDYDTEKEVRRSFGARETSTLIAFKGSRETARLVGNTDPESIDALLKSTLN